MKVGLRDGPDGTPVVDLDAELFEDIPGDLYVSHLRNWIFMINEKKIWKKSRVNEYPVQQWINVDLCLVIDTVAILDTW